MLNVLLTKAYIVPSQLKIILNRILSRLQYSPLMNRLGTHMITDCSRTPERDLLWRTQREENSSPLYPRLMWLNHSCVGKIKVMKSTCIRQAEISHTTTCSLIRLFISLSGPPENINYLVWLHDVKRLASSGFLYKVRPSICVFSTSIY